MRQQLSSGLLRLRLLPRPVSPPARRHRSAFSALIAATLLLLIAAGPPSFANNIMASTGGGDGDKDKSGKGDYGGGAIDPNKLGFKAPERAEQGPAHLFQQPPKSWPDLVGVDGEEAKKRIEEDLPGIKVQILPKDSFTTRDYRLDRVRVFVDDAGKVARTPAQG